MLAVVGVIALIVNAIRGRAMDAQDAATGCVGCGSDRLAPVGDRVRCADCGYEGAADRGGSLTERDRAAVAFSTVKEQEREKRADERR